VHSDKHSKSLNSQTFRHADIRTERMKCARILLRYLQSICQSMASVLIRVNTSYLYRRVQSADLSPQSPLHSS
jgi:hypothetical protein